MLRGIPQHCLSKNLTIATLTQSRIATSAGIRIAYIAGAAAAANLATLIDASAYRASRNFLHLVFGQHVLDAAQSHFFDFHTRNFKDFNSTEFTPRHVGCMYYKSACFFLFLDKLEDVSKVFYRIFLRYLVPIDHERGSMGDPDLPAPIVHG